MPRWKFWQQQPAEIPPEPGEEEPDTGDMNAQHAAMTDLGRRRSSNQDAALSMELPGGWVLLTVADGVGGAAGGDIASRETVNAIEEYFQSREVTDPETDLRTAAELANDRLRQIRQSEPRLAQMATTLVLALIRDRKAWLVSIGDSRAYLLDGTGLTQVTEDDSLIAEQVRAGILTEAEAVNAPGQNVVTRAIGVDEDLRNEFVVHLDLAPGVVLLLCSDGLFRPLTDEDIAATLRIGNVQEVARELIRRANAHGGPDNIGIALYREIVETPTT